MEHRLPKKEIKAIGYRTAKNFRPLDPLRLDFVDSFRSRRFDKPTFQKILCNGLVVPFTGACDPKFLGKILNMAGYLHTVMTFR